MNSNLNILKNLLIINFLFLLSCLNTISAQGVVDWEDNGDGTYTIYQFYIDGDRGSGWYPIGEGYYNDDNWDYGMDWGDLKDMLNWWDDIQEASQSTNLICPK